MEIKCLRDNQKLIVTLSGRLDSSSVHDLEATLKEKMVGAKELIFDFTNLEYLSSAGLRVLLASHKLMSGKVQIVNVNEAISDIFEMTGMSTILNVVRG